MMDRASQTVAPHLKDWVFVKERGATAHFGDVYRSADSSVYLRTGEVAAIRSEAAFGKMLWQNGFPVPEVTGIGQLPGGLGYFTEKSVGVENFGHSLGREYAATGSIGDETFGVFLAVNLRFLAAQVSLSCRQTGPSELRGGIQLANVLHQKTLIWQVYLSKQSQRPSSACRSCRWY